MKHLDWGKVLPLKLSKINAAKTLTFKSRYQINDWQCCTRGCLCTPTPEGSYNAFMTINSSSIFHISAVLPCPSQGNSFACIWVLNPCQCSERWSGSWCNKALPVAPTGQRSCAPSWASLLMGVLWVVGRSGPQCLVVSVGTWSFSQVIGFPVRAVILCRRSNHTKAKMKWTSNKK